MAPEPECWYATLDRSAWCSGRDGACYLLWFAIASTPYSERLDPILQVICIISYHAAAIMTRHQNWQGMPDRGRRRFWATVHGWSVPARRGNDFARDRRHHHLFIIALLCTTTQSSFCLHLPLPHYIRSLPRDSCALVIVRLRPVTPSHNTRCSHQD